MAKKIKDEQGNVYVQKKPFYKRWWFILLIVVIAFGVIGGNKGSDKQISKTTEQTTVSQEVQTNQEDSSTSESEATAKNESKDTVYAVGQTFTVGDMTYLVNSVSQSTNVGGEYGKNASGIYEIVNVTVTNNGKKATTVDSDYFTLLNGEVEYSSDSAAGIYANDDANFFLTEINPGSSITGNVVFDVASEVASTPGLQLQVQTGFWGTQTGLVALN
ncbi:DUF4352 domain-containing protein [Streptococcus caprae]|uniref:DUF4352 domain-containing protein n=1 Tax=Streptococcus caprae TaxID=1640501 RepID=A0ABV8CTC1_9STRE